MKTLPENLRNWESSLPINGSQLKKKPSWLGLIQWDTKLSIYLIFTAFVFVLVGTQFLPQNSGLHIGKPSHVTVISPKHFEIETKEDRAISDRVLQSRIMEVKPAYLHDSMVESNAEAMLTNMFLGLKQQQFNVKGIQETFGGGLNASLANRLASLGKEDLINVEVLVQQMMKSIFSDGIMTTEDIREIVDVKIQEVAPDDRYIPLVRAVLLSTLHPNMSYDEDATKEQVEQLKRNFTRQTTLIKKGQAIIFKGDTITASTLEVLAKIGLYRTRIQSLKLFMVALGIVLIVIVMERRMTYYVGPNNKQLMLMFSVEMIFLLFIHFMLLYTKFPDFINPAYWIPVTFFTFLISLLINEKMSMLLSNFNAVLMLLFYPVNAQAVLFLMIMTMVTNMFISHFKRRSDLPRVGIYIGVWAAIIVAVIEVNISQTPLNVVFVHSAQVFANSIISIILALGTLPYLEQLFDITTDLKLLDYGDLNNELMHRLFNESPGTYYHSLMVSSLAEAAASAVGANDILARVAAYYHDIGKLKKPEYFIENQNVDDNPHDKTLPTLSAMTILSHPRDGVELAKKYNLPLEIQQVILEHHGTSLLVYFYHKMLRITLHDVVEENQFRYDCPRPSSVESAIIMCADSVEAAVRSLDKPTPSKIRSMINKIVQDKLNDGQMADSKLTLANIETMKIVFANVIINQYHNRIKYPSQHKPHDVTPDQR
jgi:putative nucleotidyltransferase with HDIG domain